MEADSGQQPVLQTLHFYTYKTRRPSGATDSGGGDGKDEPAPPVTALLGNQRYELAYDKQYKKTMGYKAL